MPSQVEYAAMLSEAHAQARDSLVAAILKVLLGIWKQAAQQGIGDPIIVANAVAASILRMDKAQRQQRRMTRSYTKKTLELVGANMSGVKSPSDKTLVYPRNIQDFSQEWERPAVQMRYALSEGIDSPAAVQRLYDRLDSLIEQDLALADRDEASRVLTEASVHSGSSLKTVTGFRRIIHPELSRGGTCGFCAIAADRVYNIGGLMPLHPNCRCTIMPIVEGNDPGYQMNESELIEAYGSAGGTEASKLANLAVREYDHGEYGPTFTEHRERHNLPNGDTPPAWARPGESADLARWRKTLETTQASIDSIMSSVNSSEIRSDGRITRAIKSNQQLLSYAKQRISELSK